MNVATKVTKVKLVISRSMVTQRPVKLVGILALGAVLMTGTAVQFAPGSEDGSVNSPAVEEIKAPLKFTDQGEEDVAEMPYDELSKNFIGIPYNDSSSSEASGTWPPGTKYYLDPDYRVEAQRN